MKNTQVYRCWEYCCRNFGLKIPSGLEKKWWNTVRVIFLLGHYVGDICHENAVTQLTETWRRISENYEIKINLLTKDIYVQSDWKENLASELFLYQWFLKLKFHNQLNLTDKTSKCSEERH